MSEMVYFNGQLVDAAAATLPLSNPGFLHGVGLFETLRAYQGRPFRLGQHIDRLRASAAALHMTLGDSLDEVPHGVTQVLEANGLRDARIRFTITPPGAADEPARATLLVRAEQTTGYPAELYERGMTVRICNEYRQSRLDPLVGHKTTSYFTRLLALRNAQEHHCGEALWFTPDNLLAEGSISNAFIVRDGRLRTPPVDTPVLPGITRAVVLELAQRERIPCEQGPCSIDDLLDADEVFLTNAVMEVMPVTRIEQRAIGDEKAGALTRRLAELYRRLVADECSD